jgi:MYXO-CTERM domain-containing protein
VLHPCTPSTILRRTAATLTLAAGLTALTAAPALAHDQLISSTPEDGAVLDTAPERIVLTYSAGPMDMGSQLQVTDSTGDSITAGDLQINGTQVIQPLTATGAEDETYQVVWRVVSSDGHPIEGTFSYQVGDGATEPTTPTSTPTANTSTSTTQPTPLWTIATIAAILALAAVVLVALARRRRNN